MFQVKCNTFHKIISPTARNDGFGSPRSTPLWVQEIHLNITCDNTK
jgi:hypothetical protein